MPAFAASSLIPLTFCASGNCPLDDARMALFPNRMLVTNRIKTCDTRPRFARTGHPEGAVVDRKDLCLQLPLKTSRIATTYLSIRTSVDLIIAVTVSPGLSASFSTDPRVTADTISIDPTEITTSAITLPSFTSLTVPLN